MTDQEIEKQKEVEFYAASVNAWYTTSLEHDKSIFALAAGGIGLLMTLLTTIGTSSGVVLSFYGLALVSLLVSLLTLLKIFRKNNDHIIEILNGSTVVDDPKLKRLDGVAHASFAWGVIFAVVVGVTSAINSYQDKVKAMANEKQTKPAAQNIANESFNGLFNLTKSFNTVSSLRPQAAASTQNTSTPASSTQGGGSTSGASTPSITNRQ